MSSEQFLYQEYDNLSKYKVLPEKLPSLFKENLNAEFEIRPYQEEAFCRFIYYWESSQNRQEPTHLLYNMATGSGKTLIMAGLILYLYEKGYRNFVFFVNSTTILQKTKDNFLNDLSRKYLFNKKGISIGGRSIKIKPLDNFAYADSEAINLIFTTVQGLHSNLTTVKENSVSLEDFRKEPLVLLADEGHHINSLTKKGSLTNKEKEENNNWERTIRNIWRGNKQNVLLEFTATVDLEHSNIREKYLDKILYRYDLRQFCNDGYSKNIEHLQLGFGLEDIMLASVLLSQYRLKISQKYNLDVKGVILFKAKKTIAENMANYQRFIFLIENLRVGQIERLQSRLKVGTILDKVFGFYQEQGIRFESLILELQESFRRENLINVNDDKALASNQILLNNLEDKENSIRAIFAVNKLNEGWDVLNLFDIVRLYDERDGEWKSGRYKAGKTTISEVQLIGRGARYYPFVYEGEGDKYKRKFMPKDDLSIIETLHYHSKYNSRYFDELEKALIEQGLRDPKTEIREIKIRNKFSRFYKQGLVYLNSRVPNKNEDKQKVEDYANLGILKFSLETFSSQQKEVFSKKLKLQGDDPRQIVEKDIYFETNIGKEIIYHCMNKRRFFSFEELQKFFPHLQSRQEFIKQNLFSKKFVLKTSNYRHRNLSCDDKVYLVGRYLDSLEASLKKSHKKFIGTRKFKKFKVNEKFTDKQLHIKIGKDNEISLSSRVRQFFLYDRLFGTSEEASFVKFFERFLESLQKLYSQIWLVRNERQAKLFNFSDGRGFEPDFILFLQKGEKQSIHYQLFIEPKGSHLKEHDKWKQEFLQEISQEIKPQDMFENKQYKVIGLPFYNSEYEEEFEATIKEKLV